MKFVCDRCKTRYSIGDDRVRGKILKIRCKNCANVITVREGMPEPVEAEAPRRKGTTTMAPAVIASQASTGAMPVQAAAGNGALGAAFQSALTTKPPAALDEEWYVSIDGEQQGPFSLAEAQRWVASKPFDAELHCWSEGFDDWLPVDKLAHFRGLRKKPVAPPPPAAPPPLPRGTGPAARIPAAAAQPQEDEPKPLFAATMASLERSAPASSSPGLGLPSPASPSTTRPSATPASGTPAIAPRTNGSPVAARSPVFPSNGRAATTPGPGVKSFDVGDNATEIESPPFEDEAKTAAEPVAAAKKANVPLSALAANAPLSDDTDDEDDDLAIGEVSRVVNLADLARSATKRAPTTTDTNGTGSIPAINRGSSPALGQTGSVPRLGQTGTVPRLGQTGAVARIGGHTGMVPRVDEHGVPLPLPEMPPADAAGAPPAAESHKKGLALLIGGAVVLLAGVVVAVVLLVFSGDNVTNTTLAGGDQIDTTRPDDPLRKYLPVPNKTDPTATTKPGTTTTTKPTRPNVSTNPTKPDVPEIPSGSLRSDEIEEMARKYSGTTNRCYMRAQKGAEGILIGDVKKITATLDVAPDGTVRSVQLSQHAATSLGTCLIASIKSWKFRASPGGLFKISLQFVSG